MQHITSRQNPRLAEARRLAQSSRERRKAGRCILEGEHLVAVYCDRVGAPELLIVADDAADDPRIAALAARMPPTATLAVPAALFAEIAALPVDVGVLAVVPTPRPVMPAPGRFCVLLDDVQDPGNVGTMIRTAAAAGADQVVLSRNCAFAWSPKALRAGQGAQFLTAVIEDVDLIAWIGAFRSAGGRLIVGVVGDAPSLFHADLRGRIAIVVGSEGRGVSDDLLELADQRVTIPMAPGSESLNAAAAAAVLLFEGVRQRAVRA